MRKLEEIQAEIRALPTKDLWGTKKEVKELPRILSDDEHVKAICSGVVGGDTWLIVCTEKRILFLDKGLIYGLKQRETPIEKINSVEQQKGLVLGAIAIWDGATKMEIKNVAKAAVAPFVTAVHEQIETYKNRMRPSTSAAPVSTADEIRKLKGLLDDGILTQAEFDAKKAELLAKM